MRRRLAACYVWLCALTFLSAGAAAAHPLGNFTINHLAALQPSERRLLVHYVLDIAEIPTFQIMHADGGWTPQRMRDWQGSEAARVGKGLAIEANGTGLPLHLERTSARMRSGAGGLPILYWTADYDAPLPPNARISVRDSVYADRRIGWKDIVLPGLTDPTDALRAYPNALIGSPRQNDVATFDVRANGRVANARVSGDGPQDFGAASIVRSSALSDLFARNGQTPLLVLLTILAAFGLGALHGLEPGHGKALLAFTLVGARATFKQALILAVSLTFAHTAAVLLLGLALFFVAGFATEYLFTWITLVSGVAVAAIGARSLSTAWARTTANREHARAHAHGDPHSHAMAGSAPLHFRSAVVAAMSGGIAPCPAAIVVLLTALHLHRVGYGLVLIVIFSLGLATILSGLGVAVVRGSAWLQRQSGFARVAGAAPFVTASIISIIGAAMLAQGLAAQGVRISEFAAVAATLLLVAAFALVTHLFRTRSTTPPLVIKEPV